MNTFFFFGRWYRLVRGKRGPRAFAGRVAGRMDRYVGRALLEQTVLHVVEACELISSPGLEEIRER